MARALCPVLVLLAGAALCLLPRPSEAELVALRSGALLGAPRVEDGTWPTLWSRIAAESLRGSAGRATLALGPVEVRIDGVRVPEAEPLARRSIARALERLAREKSRLALDVREAEPAPESAAGTPEEARTEPFAFAVAYGQRWIALEDRTGARSFLAEEPWTPPAPGSLWPPFVATALLLLVRSPVCALLAGAWTGAFLLERAAGGGPWASFVRGASGLWTDLLRPELAAPERLPLLGLAACTLAMVALTARSGGLRGVADAIASRCGSARAARLAAVLLGATALFDERASLAHAGAALRPAFDRFRIAHGKLAGLLTASAVSIASLSLAGTWAAVELSAALGRARDGAWPLLIETLPFRFYAVLSLCLTLLVALLGRDLGPTRAAESSGAAAERAGAAIGTPASAIETAAGIAPRAYRALVPWLAFLLVAGVAVAREGSALPSTRALFLGSAAGLVVAAALALVAGLRTEILRALWTRATSAAVLALALAWMLARASNELGAASYLAAAIGGERAPDFTPGLAPALLPAVLLLAAAAVAYLSGSAWGAVLVLAPLALALALELGPPAPAAIALAAAIEGAVFGAQASPLSDRAALASAGAGCAPRERARAQLPYALLALVAALACGFLPATLLGWSPWTSLAIGAAALLATLLVAGRRSDEGALGAAALPSRT